MLLAVEVNMNTIKVQTALEKTIVAAIESAK